MSGAARIDETTLNTLKSLEVEELPDRLSKDLMDEAVAKPLLWLPPLMQDVFDVDEV